MRRISDRLTKIERKHKAAPRPCLVILPDQDAAHELAVYRRTYGGDPPHMLVIELVPPKQAQGTA